MITNPRRRHLYNIAFKRSIKALGKSGLSGESIAKESELMLEQYYADLCEMPGADMLELLADAILTHELSAKVKTLEYGILSESQIKRMKSPTANRSKGDFNYHEVELDVVEVDKIYAKYAEPYIYTREHPVGYSRKKLGIKVGRAPDYPLAEWSKKVRDRDGYQCQKCGSRCGIMHAHHIENYADNPHLRHELSNGITLCEPCHVEFHRIYGKRNNNRAQINEYLALEPIL